MENDKNELVELMLGHFKDNDMDILHSFSTLAMSFVEVYNTYKQVHPEHESFFDYVLKIISQTDKCVLEQMKNELLRKSKIH